MRRGASRVSTTEEQPLVPTERSPRRDLVRSGLRANWTSAAVESAGGTARSHIRCEMSIYRDKLHDVHDIAPGSR